MLDKLFKFPIVRLDEESEEKKRKLDLPSEEGEAEPIFAEAEYPYYDFVGIEDGWLPTKHSLEEAKQGNFDSCIVKFNNVSIMLVPWTKEKFKKQLKKFVESLKKEEENEQHDIPIIRITPEQLENIFKISDSNKAEEDGKEPE